MKAKFSVITCAALLFSVGLAGGAAAHTTVVKKNTPDDFYVAAEPDGAKSVVNSFSIPHGCNGETIIATSMLFPNGADPVIEDRYGNPVEPATLFGELEPNNNIVMGPKPAIDANWKFQEMLSGPVSLHYNHGMKDADVRSFVYRGGNLPNGFMALLPWRATFGAIRAESCLREIVMRMPIVNYCQRSPSSPARMDAWIGRLTEMFNDPATVSVGWWPQMSVVNTDFDAAACGEGEVYKVSPSDADIDFYLSIQSFKP